MRRLLRAPLLAVSCLLLTEAWQLTPSPAISQQKTTSSSTRTRRTTTQLFAERRFAQPNQNNNRRFKGDGKLAEVNAERVKTAGKVGTKRFVDPCKVFVGNLPFDVDSKQLKKHILDTMGQSSLVVHSAKVIRDWKTGKSKGYGFVMFTDPMYATICMDVVRGKELGGRPLSVSQGKKKDQDNLLYIKKKKKDPIDEEEAAIADALSEAESDLDDDDVPTFGVSDEDIELDAQLFGLQAGDEDDEDDEDDIDGWYLQQRGFTYEEVDPSLNRVQRREAARKLKKKKRPAKGFG